MAKLTDAELTAITQAELEKLMEEVKQRTKRNERLYSEVQNMNIDYVNIDVNNAIDLLLSNN